MSIPGLEWDGCYADCLQVRYAMQEDDGYEIGLRYDAKSVSAAAAIGDAQT
jgi:hypothetical protein